MQLRSLCCVLLASLGTAATLLVSGCGSALEQTANLAYAEIPGIVIHGNVHGGAYPLKGATVRLMETQVGPTLNGGNASTYASAAKLLETQTSDAYGYFNFDTNWTCTSGQYAYMTVTGGQTVSGKTNNNVIQVGVVGSCDALNANVASVNVFLSELSTVAAAYTLHNFISISPNDGSGTQQVNISAPPANLATGACTNPGSAMTCTGAGLAHGFANAANLVDSVRFDGKFPAGTANTTFLQSTNVQATIPAAMINALGNILQACVDSAGVTRSSSLSATSSDGTLCGNLFEYATPPVSNPTTPLNTLQAILNIAQYPTNKVHSLFTLQPAYTFFNPTLASDTLSNSSTPCSQSATSCIAYTVAVFYTGNGSPKNGTLQTITNPVEITLDAADNAYVLYTDTIGTGSTFGAISAFGPTGLGLYPDVQFPALANPGTIAADSQNLLWATSDTANGNLLGVSSVTGALTQTLTVPNHYAAGLAIGLANDVWVSRDSADNNQSLYRFAPSTLGSTTTYTSTLFLTPPVIGAGVKRLALTFPQNLYGVTSDSSSASQAVRFPYGKYAASTTLTTAALGTSGAAGIAIGRYMAPNGGQEAFFPLNSEIDSTNAPSDAIQVNSQSAGSLTGISTSKAPGNAAIDGAGTLFWTDNESTGQMYRLILPTGSGPSTSTSLNDATLINFYPCYVTASSNYKCNIPSTGTNLRGAVIDSSGAIWSLANDAGFTVMQTFGLAAPSYPLLAYGHGAVLVQ